VLIKPGHLSYIIAIMIGLALEWAFAHQNGMSPIFWKRL
jgi:hypothetical protein